MSYPFCISSIADIRLGADDGESAAMIMSLRQKLKAQTDEVVQLQTKLSSLVNEHKQEVRISSAYTRLWMLMLDFAERDAGV